MAAGTVSFAARVAGVPVRGTGLSVELYDPPLTELLASFDSAKKISGASIPQYIEIYRAGTEDLKEFKTGPGRNVACEYHADGLWMVQPGYLGTRQCAAETQNLLTQTGILGASWANHECATKQLFGHTFGAFVSPLLTKRSAEAVAANANEVQATLGPLLLLLETPSYHAWSAGSIGLAEYFAEISARSEVGFCLDIGHAFTFFQLERARTGISEDRFLSEWLETFPIHRIVEMHVAGSRVERPLDPRMASAAGTRYVDYHPAPNPPEYLAWLSAHLAHPKLQHLRGVAFEVDGKEPSEIIREFQTVRETVQRERPGFIPAPAAGRADLAPRPAGGGDPGDPLLREEYRRYVAVLSGAEPPSEADGPAEWVRMEREAIRHGYERMRGGEMSALFPQTSRLLEEAGIGAADFDDYFERHAAFEDGPFDFFRLVVLSFVAYVKERTASGRELSGEAFGIASTEAQLLLSSA